MDESVVIMAVMDEVRRQNNPVYPEDIEGAIEFVWQMQSSPVLCVSEL